MLIHEKFKAERLKQGYSLRSMAENAGCDKKDIQLLERGGNCTRVMMQKCAKALGMELYLRRV